MRSILWRAVLALLLMVGFYLLAAGIAGGLLFVPVAQLLYLHRVVSPKLTLICVLSGLGILWSIVPRPDRFEPPGPPLHPAEHPRLFDLIRTLAAAVGQPVPAEVYLCPEVNAWVTHRGGVMGFGSRPVMGIGLPLLQTLSVAELRAVLAHEFGHFDNADTRLGPWIYKTRAAIERTLGTLKESWLQAPFVLYAKLFLRVTHAVSRWQELLADALAARIGGPRHAMSGLEKIHGASLAFTAYWQTEVAPVLSAGFRPPLAAGFAEFIRSREVGKAIERAVSEEVQSGVADPYDTHPPLRERLGALKELTPGPEAPAASAIELLNDVSRLEHALLSAMAGEDAVGKLREVSWSDIGSQVYVPQWQRLLEKNAAYLAGITPRAFADLMKDSKGFLAKLRTSTGDKVPASERRSLGASVLGAGLLLGLLYRGWRLSCAPGEAVALDYGERRVEPFNLLARLAGKEIAPDAFLAICEETGIVDVVVVAH